MFIIRMLAALTIMALCIAGGLSPFAGAAITIALCGGILLWFADDEPDPQPPYTGAKGVAPAPHAPLLLPPPVEIEPPAPYQPDASPTELFEQTIVAAIQSAWVESTYSYEQSKPGHFQARLEQPRYYSNNIVFSMTLTGLLPIPQMEAIIDTAFVMALRAKLRTMSQNTDMIDRVTAQLKYMTIEISVPNPSQNVDMNIAHFLQFAKPGVALDYHDRQDCDLYGIVGVDNEDNIVYLDFPWNAVSLYVGGQRTGKSGALMALLLSVLAMNGPERVELYICAARPIQWEPFAKLPHTRGVAFNDGAAIDDLLKSVWQKTMQGVALGSAGTHPSRILVVDDLSAIAKYREWKSIAGTLIQLVTSGGGGQTYTLITTHRTRQSGGVGDAGTAIVANAGFRVVTNTADNAASFADALNVPGPVAARAPMPRIRKEALVTVNGSDPELIRTIYAKPEDVETLIPSDNGTTPTGASKRAATKTDNGKTTRDTVGWGSLPPSIHRGVDTDENSCRSPEHDANVHNTQPHTYTNGTHKPTRVGHVSAHGQNGASDADNATNVDSTISGATRREVRARDGNVCTYCQGEGNDTIGPDRAGWHYDHMLPKSLGGSGNPGNVCVACRTCNQEKGAMTPHEFIERKMRQMDGSVPKLKLYEDGYRPTPWQKIQMWFAFEHCGASLNSIMIDAGLGKGGAQGGKVKGWIAEGADHFERIRSASQDQDQHPTGIDLSAFVDEIERRESEIGDD